MPLSRTVYTLDTSNVRDVSGSILTLTDSNLLYLSDWCLLWALFSLIFRSWSFRLSWLLRTGPVELLGVGRAPWSRCWAPGAVPSLLAERGLGCADLSGCSAQASLFPGVWDVPSPGMESVSPAWQGRFFTSGPPGKLPPRVLAEHSWGDSITPCFFP